MKIKYNKPETEIVELEATEKVGTKRLVCISGKQNWDTSEVGNGPYIGMGKVCDGSEVDSW